MKTYTLEEIGTHVFHINEASVVGGNVRLEVIVGRHENEVEACQIEFPLPPAYAGQEEHISGFSGMHMVSFQDGLLADARSVWGYSCPCERI